MNYKIVISRDSVCAGDDVDDHSIIINVKSDSTIERILKQINDMGYLPTISGGKATWSVVFNQPLAIVAQEWQKAKLMVPIDYPYPGTNYIVKLDKIHFNYHAQLDPEVVYQVLWGFKTI